MHSVKKSLSSLLYCIKVLRWMQENALYLAFQKSLLNSELCSRNCLSTFWFLNKNKLQAIERQNQMFVVVVEMEYMLM